MTRHWVIVLGLAIATPSLAQQRIEQQGELSGSEIRTALRASRAVFSAQAAERREADASGLAALEAELRALHQTIADAAEREKAERRKLPVRPGAPSATPAEAALESAPWIEQVQRQLDDIHLRGAAIETKIAGLKSPRQRAVARSVLARLEALDGETRAALDAPKDEREKRLADLAARLTVMRIRGASRESKLPAPTETTMPSRPGPTRKAEPRYGQGRR
jgi:hypothetical protein